jgi:hypothetical protein
MQTITSSATLGLLAFGSVGRCGRRPAFEGQGLEKASSEHVEVV